MPSKATTATTSSWLTSAALPLLLLYYTVAEASQGPSELLQSAKKFSKREKDGESTSFSLDTTSCEGEFQSDSYAEVRVLMRAVCWVESVRILGQLC